MVANELPNVDTIRQAASHVLGDSSVGRSIVDLCERHAESLRHIMADRSPDATTIAVIGATGQGKSWFIRQLILDANVRQRIRSGDSQEEATRRLYWFGPTAPIGIDSRYETFCHCESGKMIDLGGPYLVVDTPGATDCDANTVAIAERAISMASVLVLVVRRQQVRSEVPTRLASASDGTLIIPVINAIRGGLADADLRSDVDALVSRLRDAAPRAEVVTPLLVPDFEVHQMNESEVGTQLTGELIQVLRPHLAGGDIGNRRRGMRIGVEQDRFRENIRQILGAHLPRVSRAVDQLEKATNQLPHEVAVELIGSGQTLRAGIRSRLRMELLVSTAAMWFPYRSLIGILNLTHGAWDRVILALSGSLPSLISAAWTSVQNIAGQPQQGQAMSLALRNRSASIVQERLQPHVRRFHGELLKMHSPEGVDHHVVPGDEGQLVVEMLGIDSLLERTQQIFDDEVAAITPRPLTIFILGLVGTILFWCLMAGPIVSLYRVYIEASYQSVVELSDELERFPHPSGSMMFTSLVLSLVPTSLFAMLVLSWVQRRSRQEVAAQRINSRLEEAIAQLQQEGVLRLEFRDNLLEGARMLLRT
jgi:hypothetical protein